MDHQASPSRQEQLRSLEEALRRQLESKSTFIRWALVGGSAYLLYQALLFLMYDFKVFWFLPAKDTSADIIFFEHTDVRFLIATLVSSTLSTVAHFAVHDLWTFRDRASVRKPVWMRFWQFVATVSIAVVLVAVMLNVLTVRFGIYHFVALPISVSLASIWNWLWSSRYVWRSAKREDAPS